MNWMYLLYGILALAFACYAGVAWFVFRVALTAETVNAPRGSLKLKVVLKCAGVGLAWPVISFLLRNDGND